MGATIFKLYRTTFYEAGQRGNVKKFDMSEFQLACSEDFSAFASENDLSLEHDIKQYCFWTFILERFACEFEILACAAPLNSQLD
jgi:hypothetical protein